MKTKASAVTCLVILLTIAFSTMGMADHSYGGKSGYHKRGLEEKFFHKTHFILEHEQEMGLAEEQATSIKELMMETKKSLIRQDADIAVLAIDIKAMLHEKSIDVEAVDPLIDQKYEVKKSKAKMLVRSFASLKGLLTEEQMATMKSLWMQKMKGK